MFNNKSIPKIVVVVALVFASPAFAQAPDQRGEISIPATSPDSVPTYRGIHANAPIPSKMHQRNEGGSDGAGLCVICSIVINGRFQGIPEPLLKELWETAKSRPGGYSPGNLAALLREVCPAEKYASYIGTDPEVLERLSKQRFPIGATMNTGALYRYKIIAHMISLIHFQRDSLACVVDNNDPGFFHWMPSDEFLRRFVDGGIGWAFTWLRKPPFSAKIGNTQLAIVLVLTAASLVLITRGRRGSSTKYAVA